VRTRKILVTLAGGRGSLWEELRTTRASLVREAKFATDSLLEGAVTSEPVSEAEIPC
jgi:hypothetical protein